MENKDLQYKTNVKITPGQFVDILKRSGLSERRPVDDAACIAGMLENGNLAVSAWNKDALVGIARSITDFYYCCYLSDLAVDRDFQRQGIGRELISRTQAELGSRCTIILLSAPKAVDYYPRIGMQRHPQAWILDRKRQIN